MATFDKTLEEARRLAEEALREGTVRAGTRSHSWNREGRVEDKGGARILAPETPEVEGKNLEEDEGEEDEGEEGENKDDEESDRRNERPPEQAAESRGGLKIRINYLTARKCGKGTEGANKYVEAAGATS
ncbi:uncharacterized protein MELLADRAFT_105078 [Melampsora larici-populina 98AG31]|uniref:Uncharacterized protein n=1 Tax=Melampsora larici-populina (strain 98AG31 / pathotype 3-4-7) TaxID=747676 RepID=F4RH64_MELLP|nr:uncharacterized protein MELLADRAFT_105078 [Melampsora larici-populina 98AG31]EGG08141.1 hypothetical protein MELLADRAFT_105078 [Melampsora larici-populina 98AG31]